MPCIRSWWRARNPCCTGTGHPGPRRPDPRRPWVDLPASGAHSPRAGRATMTRTYKIAAVPGGGIGNETVPEGLLVLEAAATKFGFQLQTTEYDWSCERY